MKVQNPPKTVWNKNKLIGQKLPLKPEQIWSIRVRLEMQNNIRDLALFNLALDSKLRACDLLKLTVGDISRGEGILSRTQVIQQKTKRPVQFEITKKTKLSLQSLIEYEELTCHDYLFKGQSLRTEHLSTRQYARIVDHWVTSIGLDKNAYGTHSMRRTEASIIYKKTKNLRAVQILLGHTKLESTVRYLGVEVDDALEISEHIEI